MDEKQFLETSEIHNRISLYLLDAVEPASLVSLSLWHLGVGREVKTAGSAYSFKNHKASETNRQNKNPDEDIPGSKLRSTRSAAGSGP